MSTAQSVPTPPAHSLRPRPRRVDPQDLTARARIRDAALFCFARDGFRVPLRVIAEEAGVSVPLITHHYGTKNALHQTCDDRVLEHFLDMKIMAIRQPDTVKGMLEDTSIPSILMVYMVRSFLDATDSAGRFFERFVDQLRTTMEAALEAGMVAPAADEEERVHLLATQAIGSLMVEFVIHPPADPRTFIDQVYSTRNLAAQFDLYSHAMFVPSPAMDTYLDSIRDRP